MLTLGTIVYLNEGQQKLVVISRGALVPSEGKNKLYDYSACYYPHGMDPEKVFYFNEENVAKVVFEGYRDEEEERFEEIYNEWLEKNKDTYTKSIVTGPNSEF